MWTLTFENGVTYVRILWCQWPFLGRGVWLGDVMMWDSHVVVRMAGDSPPNHFRKQKPIFMQSVRYCYPNSTRTGMCRQSFENSKMSNLIKILSAVVELLHKDRQTDRRGEANRRITLKYGGRFGSLEVTAVQNVSRSFSRVWRKILNSLQSYDGYHTFIRNVGNHLQNYTV
jgi:hypothetical protein